MEDTHQHLKITCMNVLYIYIMNSLFSADIMQIKFVILHIIFECWWLCSILAHLLLGCENYWPSMRTQLAFSRSTRKIQGCPVCKIFFQQRFDSNDIAMNLKKNIWLFYACPLILGLPITVSSYIRCPITVSFIYWLELANEKTAGPDRGSLIPILLWCWRWSTCDIIGC